MAAAARESLASDLFGNIFKDVFSETAKNNSHQMVPYVFLSLFDLKNHNRI